MSIVDAFDQVCADAKVAEGYYVSLMRKTSRYGGPEEGGWWVEDSLIVKYKYFATEEMATAAADAVKVLAAQLRREARTAHGNRCLAQMDWLEDRMLDADYLPEDDGPDDYYVLVTNTFPEESYGPRSYE